jgi:curved DNA-binding protein CbpA
MVSQISQGLFSTDFTDFHAVIGAPVDANGDEIRKRYLQIAKRLHPDTLATASPEDRQIAAEILSKLVNPARQKLSKEKDLTEYQLLLKLKGKEAIRSGLPVLRSPKARELQNAQNWSAFYQSALQELANQQYEVLSQSLNLIGELSELNLVYLVRRESQASDDTSGSRSPRPVAKPSSSTPPFQPAESTPVASPSSGGSVDSEVNDSSPATPLSIFIDAYCRRAEELMEKNQFSAAIKELRDALKDDPNNSRCHALMGQVYLKQKQLTMARISFDQALKFDPKNESALKGKQEIERLSKDKGGKSSSGPKTPPNEKSGGLFGLFGGRKK